jgi:hypothetical protein
MIRILACASFTVIATLLMAPIFSQAVAQEAVLQPETPELKDRSGTVLTNAVAGELSVISATVNNNSTQDENFVAMVEARSSIGITELLEFQIAQASENNSIEFGISWTPEEAGTYELRTYLLSGLQEPQVLSEVTTKQITVEEN